MRVVLDTNVLVSGVMNPQGAPGRLIDALLIGTVTALYDDRTLAEYREVLMRPAFGFSRTDVDALIDFITAEGEPTAAASLALVLPDPSDLPFLEIAATGDAPLITGNAKHFKSVRGRHSVDVCSPADFVIRLAT